MLILSSLLILFRNKLIGSQPSITADKRVHIRIYIYYVYTIAGMYVTSNLFPLS